MASTLHDSQWQYFTLDIKTARSRSHPVLLSIIWVTRIVTFDVHRFAFFIFNRIPQVSVHSIILEVWWFESWWLDRCCPHKQIIQMHDRIPDSSSITIKNRTRLKTESWVTPFKILFQSEKPKVLFDFSD